MRLSGGRALVQQPAPRRDLPLTGASHRAGPGVLLGAFREAGAAIGADAGAMSDLTKAFAAAILGSAIATAQWRILRRQAAHEWCWLAINILTVSVAAVSGEFLWV